MKGVTFAFMGKLRNTSDLDEFRLKLLAGHDPDKPCVTVCMGTGCHAYENEKVFAALEKEIKSRCLFEKVDLKGTGCRGFCEQGPIVVIFPAEIFYCRVKPEDAAEIITSTILENTGSERLLLKIRQPAEVL